MACAGRLHGILNAVGPLCLDQRPMQLTDRLCQLIAMQDVVFGNTGDARCEFAQDAGEQTKVDDAIFEGRLTTSSRYSGQAVQITQGAFAPRSAS